MKIIGLTGGIASGKSTASGILRELGAYIVDADRIAREIMTPGSEALSEVVKAFGESVLNPDKSLKRSELARIVFNDPEGLLILNRITHPRIIAAVKQKIQELAQIQEILILDAALLIELNLESLVDETWLLCVPPETQMERLLGRESMSREDAEKIIQAQLPLEVKMKAADICIDNTGTPEELYRKIKKMWDEQVKK